MLDPNHPQWKAFVRSMLVHPAEDTPRLLFADWLDETYGATAMGELIRLMIGVAAEDFDNVLRPAGWDKPVHFGQPGWKVYRQCHELLTRTWFVFPPLQAMTAEALAQWQFHRGFPIAAYLDWVACRRNLDTLAAIGPINLVTLADRPPVYTETAGKIRTYLWGDDETIARLREPAIRFERPVDPRERRFQVLAAVNNFLHQIWGAAVGHITCPPSRPHIQFWRDGPPEYWSQPISD